MAANLSKSRAATFLPQYLWLSDGSALVYSSSACGDTSAYPPPFFNLRVVSRKGENNRQILLRRSLPYLSPGHAQIWKTVGESHQTGNPTSGAFLCRKTNTGENTQEAGSQITRQTGQVQTQSVSPDGREYVYLDDSGGYGNLSVGKTNGGE